MARHNPLGSQDILVDTREQLPFWPDSPRATLRTGDYSVTGCTASIAVERKSIGDLLGSLGGKGGSRRKRLEAEFARLGAMRAGALVVEGSPGSIFAAPQFGRISPAHAIGAVISWSIRYRVPVLFADDRAMARSLTRTFLRLARDIVAEEARSVELAG